MGKFHILAVILACVAQVTSRAATFYVNVSNTAPVAPYSGWPSAATNIQDAIDAASDNDLILVTNGLYATGGRVVYGTLTNRVVINKVVTVQSVNGPAVTVIQGYQVPSGSTAYTNDIRCVYMTNNTVLNGFTITGGSALASSGGNNATFANSVLSGGGVFCETTNSIVITNCILCGNLCVSGDSSTGGGAVYQGTLWSCTISNNLVATNGTSYGVNGGGAYRSILNNCLIISNSASFGGGASFCTLTNCPVIGNIAPNYGSTSWGGGTFGCTAYHCLIAGNVSTTIGGGDCYGQLFYCVLSNNVCISPAFVANGGGSYRPMLNNCLVVSNYCYGDGGGVYYGSGGGFSSLTNCTIVGNTATNQGGGVYDGVLNNTIVYGNYCPSRYSASSNTFTTTLISCWTNDPLYLNPTAGDYHLQSSSPCINAGKNAYVTLTNDLDGNPRIVGGTVDIGAFEYQTPASIISYAWLEQYGLPVDGSADYADTDHTGMNNWQKWIAGLNPTNPASLLVMQPLTATNNAGGIKVSWQSVNTRSYYLQRSTDLTQPFPVLQSNLVGQTGTTSYTDSTATNASPYYYRVGVQ